MPQYSCHNRSCYKESDLSINFSAKSGKVAFFQEYSDFPNRRIFRIFESCPRQNETRTKKNIIPRIFCKNVENLIKCDVHLLRVFLGSQSFGNLQLLCIQIYMQQILTSICFKNVFFLNSNLLITQEQMKARKIWTILYCKYKIRIS